MAAPTDAPALAMTSPVDMDPRGETTRLVIRAREGDLTSFEALVTRFQSTVYRAALGMLRHVHDAEDATQETFLRLYRFLHRLDPSRPVEPWLYRITMNVCRDIARQRKRLPATIDADGIESLEVRTALHPSEGSEDRALILELLSLLPEKERRALVLRDVEGLSTGDVAEILGSSETTVRSQISRGRTRLREAMSRRRRSR